jgi:hypothetical protein
MKGGDETHGVSLGSSLHGSLPLVLFIRFWLVFFFLDLVLFLLLLLLLGVVVVLDDDGDGCDER